MGNFWRSGIVLAYLGILSVFLGVVASKFNGVPNYAENLAYCGVALVPTPNYAKGISAPMPNYAKGISVALLNLYKFHLA